MENLTTETVRTIKAYNVKAEKLWSKVYNIRETLKDIFPTVIEPDSDGEYKVYTFQSDEMFKRKLLSDGLKSEMYTLCREMEKLESEHRDIANSLKEY